MSPIASYLVSIIIGVTAGGLFSGYQVGTAFNLDLATCGAFAAIALAGALINQVMVASRAGATIAAGSNSSSPAQNSRKTRPPAQPASSSQSSREQGLVKWFNYSKGFGFITRDSGDDIFVHFKSIRGEGQGKRGLRDGQRVEFSVTEGEKGLQAEDVDILP